MRRRGALWAGGAVLAAAATAAAWLLAAAAGDPDAELWRVERRAFTRRVAAEGNLRALRATPITTPADVQDTVKVAWLAPDGSRVRAGETVVRLDSTDFEIQLRDAAAERSIASERIGKAESRRSTDLEALERDAGLAGLEMESARTFQRRDAQVFSRHELLESEIDLGLAEARKRHAESVRDTRAQVSSTELELLGLERRKADIKIQRAEQGLAAITIAAPHDGILLLQRDWRGEPVRVGESVWNGRKLAEIPDLGAMEADVWVLESDAGGLAAGQAAEVVIDAAPGVVWPATVKRVDALARPRLRGVPVQYFGATLTLARTDPAAMKPGQRLRASIVLESLADVLTVPRQALFERDGGHFVYRRRRGGFEEAPVELGAAAGGMVTVTQGLAEGDAVALRDPGAPLDDGAARPGAAPAAPRGPAAP